MENPKKSIIRATVIIAILIITGILINNLLVNLIRTGMGLSFEWLFQPSGFALAENLLPYKPSDSYAWALFIGWLNSLKIIFFGLFLATLLGFTIGIARISRNILIRKLSSAYVALIRQIPLLLQLLFWYFVALLSISEANIPFVGSIIKISNKGINFLGLNLSIEFTALLIGLTIFTAAAIAEIVRGGLNSVNKGQWEAFRSLGLNEDLGMRLIVIPQALPAILPGLTSQYLNLAKNSTLAIAVGYSDIYAVSDTIITQTGRAIEGFSLLLISFLILNVIISSGMNTLNNLVLNANYKK